MTNELMNTFLAYSNYFQLEKRVIEVDHTSFSFSDQNVRQTPPFFYLSIRGSKKSKK